MASTKGYIRLELFKNLVLPFTPMEARNKIPKKAVKGQFQCSNMLTDWLMLNKKTSSHLHSFKTVRPQ